MKMLRFIFILTLICFMAVGCASSRSSGVYSRDQARQTHTVQYGTVERVKYVKIEGTKSVVGPLAGAAAGAAVGSTIGSGSGKTVAVVLGGLAGAAAGGAVEEGITKKEGLEITVKLDNGEIIAVVQEADVTFATGEKVRVLRGSDGTTRVTR